MNAKEELYKQMTGALKGAKFPIKTPEELIKAFPAGADTKCSSGKISMTAGEAGKLLKPSDFPFKTAADVANTILTKAGL